jgi:hypothetical protein
MKGLEDIVYTVDTAINGGHYTANVSIFCDRVIQVHNSEKGHRSRETFRQSRRT